MADYLQELNELQQKAVLETEGPVMIVAGAGTGKTKTLTYRMYHLIRNGVAPEKILGITFTNKAAKEMRERVMHLLQQGAAGSAGHSEHGSPLLRTFHSLGVWILRKYFREAGLPKFFTILDSDDSGKIIRDAMKKLGFDPKENDPRIIRSIISREKGECVTVEEYESKIGNARMQIAHEVWEEYEKTKKNDNALDFDDLLLTTLHLLKNNQKVREELQNTWQYIHVDEYQDTNKVQYEIVRILAMKHKNLCVVGDTDQNIYSWRGANIKNMLEFQTDYPEAVMLVLEENYRSTKTILAAADAVITKNKARFEKNLRTSKDDGAMISCLATLNEADEAYHVARHAKKCMQSGILAHDIAVLYRTNFQSRALEEGMLREGVPYQVIGTKFFERKEIKDALAYLRAALHPENLVDVKRIINEPKRGLGPAAVATIFSGQGKTLSGKQAIAYEDFLNILARIRAYAHENPLSKTIRFIITTSGLYDLLRNGSEEDRERLLNLEELVTFATRYDPTSLPLRQGSAGQDSLDETMVTQDELEKLLESFLEDTALRSDQDDDEKGKDGVRLMTIHAAKGLEFRVVFIVGMEAGLFPGAMSNERKTVEEREEERRLFYVAITRAKEQLFLSYAHMRTRYGEQKFNMPSEFLADIPVELIEHEEIASSDEDPNIKTHYLDF